MIRPVLALALGLGICACDEDASVEATTSALSSSDAAPDSSSAVEHADFVTAGPCTRPGSPLDFIRAVNSGEYEVVMVTALEVLGEEIVYQSVDSGTYETRALRISVAGADDRVSRVPQSYREALVPIHSTTRFTAYETGDVTQTIGCPDARHVDEQGSLASRIEAGRRGEMALVVELTAIHGPIVRNIVTRSGDTLRFDHGDTLQVAEIRSASEAPIHHAVDVIPEWVE